MCWRDFNDILRYLDTIQKLDKRTTDRIPLSILSRRSVLTRDKNSMRGSKSSSAPSASPYVRPATIPPGNGDEAWLRARGGRSWHAMTSSLLYNAETPTVASAKRPDHWRLIASLIQRRAIVWQAGRTPADDVLFLPVNIHHSQPS